MSQYTYGHLITEVGNKEKNKLPNKLLEEIWLSTWERLKPNLYLPPC